MNPTMLTFMLAGIFLVANATVLILIVAVVLIAAGFALWYMRKRHSETIRKRFGPEYQRTVAETGTARKAEQVLEKREKRVASYHIRPLAPADRERFSESWRQVQAQFVDDPSGAVSRADQLVADVLQARGYPLSDFWQRAEDISVDHPAVVENYRAAHEIAERQSRGQASTEDLRKAMVHYRTLFEDLLGTDEAVPTREAIHTEVKG